MTNVNKVNNPDKIIVTKQEARQKRLKRYNTGVPCNTGHYSERYVANDNCCECAKILRKRKYHEHK